MDDEEEVLLALAETLATLLGHVGGPQYAPSLMKPLQRLCAQEDVTVREKVRFLDKNTAFSVAYKNFLNHNLCQFLSIFSYLFLNCFRQLKVSKSCYPWCQ